MAANKLDSSDKIFNHFIAITLTLQRSTIVVIARITTQRRQSIRCERYKAGNCQSPRDIFYIRIQTTIFVDNNNCGQLVLYDSRSCKIATHYTSTFR